MSKPEKEKTPPKVEHDVLVLRNTRLEAQNSALTDELTYAKKQLLEIRDGYATRVSNNIKLDIQTLLGCDDPTLTKLTAGKSIDELESMLNHLVIAHDAGVTAIEKGKQTFKSIRATGAAVAGDSSGMTVGCLFGKSPKEIRELGGDF